MAETKRIKGIIGACLTPFDDNDNIDYRALEKEMDFLLPDCDAITIAAVEAAEYTMLSREERKELLKLGTQMVDKRVPVIIGCSSPSPREVIELADYAATIGGDFVQVLMPLRPWGGQPTIAELMSFTLKSRRQVRCQWFVTTIQAPERIRPRMRSSRLARLTIFATSRKARETLQRFPDSLNKLSLPDGGTILRRCSHCW